MKVSICKEETVHSILEKAINDEFVETMEEHKKVEEEMIDTLDDSTLNETSYSFEPVKNVSSSFIQDLETQTTTTKVHRNKWMCTFSLFVFVACAIAVPVALIAGGKMMVPQTTILTFLFPLKKLGVKGNIPILLDSKGTSPIHDILLKCFRLNSRKDFEQVEGEEVDFYVVNSVCDIPRSIRWNKNFRIFFLMKNPFEESYSKTIEVNDDEESATNPLTRSIVCNSKGKLTERDLEKARRFLKEKSDVDLAAYYPYGIKMLQEKYNWNGTKNTDNCIKSNMKSTFLNRHILNNEVIFKFEESYKSNNYDIKLYMDYVGNKMNQTRLESESI